MMNPSMPSTQPTHANGLALGDKLSSPSSKYLLKSFLGQGTFGTVVRCVRLKDMTTVALKMMKDISNSLMAANHEVSIMRKLKALDPDRCNIVRWHEIFIDRGHICLEFEHLDKSLYDFMRNRAFRPLPLTQIRPVVQQLANALNHLKTFGIIHADIKWENVMLVDQEQKPYTVKLIDFGLACNVSEAKLGAHIQTRPYRSPEIILGLPFTEAIDMWSLGCLAASLYLGALLYEGINEHDMIRLIMATQGPLPNNMLSHGFKTSWFFKREHKSGTTSWRLKELQQNDEQRERRTQSLRSLDELARIDGIKYYNYADYSAHSHDLPMFVDMIKGMLQLDPAERITPSQVLEHRFISLSHIAHLESMSPYVRSSFKYMASHRIQQLPPPAAEPKCNISHLGASSHTTNSGKSGIKRSLEDEGGKVRGTSQPSKRVKSTHDNGTLPKSCALQSASSRRSQTHSCISPSVKRKRTNEEEPGHKKKRSRSTSSEQHRRVKPMKKMYIEASSRGSQTQSCISPSVKRKRTNEEEPGHMKKRSRSTSSEQHRRVKPMKKMYIEASSRGSQTQSCISPSVKRKRTNEEEPGHKKKRSRSTSSEQRRRVKPMKKMYIEASSRGSQTQSCISPSVKRKRTNEEEPGHRKKRSRSTSSEQRRRVKPMKKMYIEASSRGSQTQSCISPSVKRKRTNEEEPGHRKKRSRSTSSEQRRRVKPMKKMYIEDPCTQPRVKRQAPDDDDDKDVRPAKMPMKQ
ncbi:Homeodomain-interacting protein kinase 1 [Collichthys lucidus]|uniref:Homeodomain-interacting protein kinase 1 n=1 Tax=Collichthys lucidus TaxID=240159 RepID=A0A4U5V889_COLLU|nr:Homeodomain-interacting protein kinase 1 [Collichthys lucidus]